MKTATLNLCNNPLTSYEEIRYPAGETQVRFKPESLQSLASCDQLNIIARINSAQDLITLLHFSSALEDPIFINTKKYLILPYLPYSRADRRFVPGDCGGLEVFGSIINSRSHVYQELHTLDAHNEHAAFKYVNRLYNHSALSLVHKAIHKFTERHNSDHVTVLFPDEGARTRYVVPGHLSCNTQSLRINVLHCEKKRDTSTGKFLGFNVPWVDPTRPAFIIDDICDGGGTFNGIAAELRKQHSDSWPAHHLGLYVTHGIFSKGFGELNENFNHIYTTNTLPEKGPDKLVTVMDAMPILLGHGG